MADLGAIAKNISLPVNNIYTPQAFSTRALMLTAESKIQSPAGALKQVGGQARVEGVLTPDRVVRIYDHATGELLYETKSDGSGNWSCPSLNAAKIMAVAVGDDTYNAQVYDMVVPD